MKHLILSSTLFITSLGAMAHGNHRATAAIDEAYADRVNTKKAAQERISTTEKPMPEKARGHIESKEDDQEREEETNLDPALYKTNVPTWR